MFKLTSPCATCPFRRGMGPTMALAPGRIAEIAAAPAFQCHKTVDYDRFDDPAARQGESPQQCAGLMSLLHRAGTPRQIMQVGQRLGHFDPGRLRHGAVYASLAAAVRAHKR